MNSAGQSPSENPIRLLQELKDQIIAAFKARTELDDATRNIWSGDAKEMYYTVVAADGLLSRLGDADLGRAQLSAASSRFGQVRSELRAIGAVELEAKLEKIFHHCHSRLSARVPAIPAAQTVPARVIKISPESYELPCSLCGRIAVTIHPASDKERILKGIIVAGITRSLGLNPKDHDRIYGWLANEDLAALHRYMDHDCDIDGGLDAYCPDCDRIYCRTHYKVTEIWDEGFYDCSKATCPQGHSREIDD
jgi:hypothetical protein